MQKGNPATRRRKTVLTKKQINHFRDLLENKRRALLGSVQSLESDALRGSGDSSTHKPFHPDDQSSEAYNQDFKLQLAASERQLLEEIDLALQRIEEGRFGICEATNKPIQLSRLEAKPWAHMCIEAARERDRRNALYPQT